MASLYVNGATGADGTGGHDGTTPARANWPPTHTAAAITWRKRRTDSVEGESMPAD